ncbi:MAG: LLM class flavin-dependent oxidoreductase, partial [Proteobacteria bacterium]|nr:LLM class flavin-dependent oxidoreductase [Pseudomonadota bacterium]
MHRAAMNEGSQSFVVVGDHSLTIACAGELLKRSHRIVGLITDSSTVASWAKEQSVQLIGIDQLHEISPADYLLSAANLRVLTAEELAIPTKGAINFHDGPLPELSGVNNTSWAILSSISEYGVTWHEMSGDVDRGDILESERFTLEPDETAVSLNTKCFHAGFRTFQELLSQIEAGALNPTAQPEEGDRRYFAKWARPKAACTLQWHADADDIEAVMRSLTFGPYENVMGLPKVQLPTGLAAVGKIIVLPGKSEAEPGTVVEVANNSARIATATNDIRISRLCNLTTKPIPMAGKRIRLVADCGIKVGQILPNITNSLSDDLDSLVRQSARAESHWVQQLVDFNPLGLPRADTGAKLEATLQLPAGLQSASGALASVAAYLGRCFNADEFGLWMRRDQEQNPPVSDYFLERSPLHVRLDWNMTANELAGALSEELEAALELSLPLSDIGLRYQSLEPTLSRVAAEPTCELALIDQDDMDRIALESVGLLFSICQKSGVIRVSAKGVFRRDAFQRFVDRFEVMLKSLGDEHAPRISECRILTDADRKLIAETNNTKRSVALQTVHAMFQDQAKATPDRHALVCGREKRTYQQLDRDSDHFANALRSRGVAPGDLVGIMMGRSIDLLTVLMGVIKLGAAYVPLDPTYPRQRLQLIIGDCRPTLVVADRIPAWKSEDIPITLCGDLLEMPGCDEPVPAIGLPSDLMYVIYTSGSTGKPKGVQVCHDNVHNFFAGIDDRIGSDPGILLAATSISFDISVLELFWTLCRGFTVVIHDDNPGLQTQIPDQPIGFSLFFWNIAESSSTDDAPYDLVLNASAFADSHDFDAVWTPERHFGGFGGAYPNPSVISAALAVTTSRVAIRAGSCVMPLHHPIRVVEEWSVVDNLSRGRVGISMAAGWNANDFVLRPDNFANAKDVMFENIEQVRRLWRGESVTFEGPRGPIPIKTLPKPVQPELPVWITAASNPDTFRKAGEIGAGILTHLLGQTLNKVGANIELYRDAWKSGGSAGKGHVTLMVHTFVAPAEEEAKSASRAPMKNYLKSAMALVKEAAWEFPTFQKF